MSYDNEQNKCGAKEMPCYFHVSFLFSAVFGKKMSACQLTNRAREALS